MRIPNRLNESALAYSVMALLRKPGTVSLIVECLDKDIEASYNRIRCLVVRMTREGLIQNHGKGLVKDGRLVFYALTPKGVREFGRQKELLRRLVHKR